MPETKALTPVDDFKIQVDRMEPELQKMLPDHIPAKRFTRVLKTAAQLEPRIASSDKRVLWGEIMKCAQDGLIPDGREATINIYNSKSGPPTAKYIPMIGGICKKARNSGLIQTIDAQVVYENDTYEAWIDEKGQHFKFMRAKGDRGKVRLTFGYAITKDEGFFFEEIDEEQMLAIEKSSRASTGPWKGAFKDEMRRKSALRRLAKYRLPSSSDLDDIIKRDDDLYDLNKGNPEEPTKEAPKTSSRLHDAIDSQAEPEPEAQEPEVIPPPTQPTQDPPIVEDPPI